MEGKKNSKAAVTEKAVEKECARYTREQILESRRFRGQRDLICALLEDGKRYSMAEVDRLVNGYLKGKVM
ncbi:MAG: hypothetical protein PHV18_05110 [Lachnospiraceae bacterium]|nr:hypothetical protein [Lachnospiraceae bacterium]